MKDLGKPVNNKRDEIEKAVKKVFGDQQMPKIDFQNTEVAFAHKSDEELKKMAWLFGICFCLLFCLVFLGLCVTHLARPTFNAQHGPNVISQPEACLVGEIQMFKIS